MSEQPTDIAAQAEDKVLYSVAESGVATITLNEPSTRNALSQEVLDGLIACVRAGPRR